ncbi:MAG TPA: AI-2E family transporter [Burkholderiales bacterium]|nr:AI-2E family transporter [Burkholderiales bacterium]
MIALLIAAAVLYLAKEVLVPLAMAILLSFLLAPLVRRLEQWKLGRVPSTLIVVLLGFGVIFGVAGLAGSQALSLAAKLPEYRHNIVSKIHALRMPTRDSTIGKAAEAIKDLEEEAAPERPPIAVKETAGTPVEAFMDFIAPVAKPLAMTLAVIVFTILMLVNRENMRERVIAVIGAGRINVTTKAMAEASYRVSRYLSMQLVVNVMFGVPFGIALYFIGVPNALLWGLLGTLLRFIPYAGVWVAAAMPAALAFGISDGWSMVIWTFGVFLALELVLANAVEPWLYGRSAGLAPIAIITAAIFWTWLWGPIGLLLATPLTVCVAVMGRHIPEFGYLNVLLGVEPVLSPEERFYQRLIALDEAEAAELIDQHIVAHGSAATFDDVIIPALSLAERDRRKGALEPARERFVYEHVRRMIEDADVESSAGATAPICIVPARDEADHVAALMVARLLGPAQCSIIAPPPRTSEIAELMAQKQCKMVLISAVPPNAAHDAGYLARRLKRQIPGVKIAVGLWGAEEELARAEERLAKLGVDEVLTRVSEAPDIARQLADAANQENASETNPVANRRAAPG